MAYGLKACSCHPLINQLHFNSCILMWLDIKMYSKILKHVCGAVTICCLRWLSLLRTALKAIVVLELDIVQNVLTDRS